MEHDGVLAQLLAHPCKQPRTSFLWIRVPCLRVQYPPAFENAPRVAMADPFGGSNVPLSQEHTDQRHGRPASDRRKVRHWMRPTILIRGLGASRTVSYTHLRAHET